MSIIKTDATITALTDLSATAREITLTPAVPFPFKAGSFVNVFADVAGETLRRAYSISSTDARTDSFTISVRQTIGGKLSPLFWDKASLGRTISIMGPLGINTADKFTHSTIYLCGFGIGAGVIKAVLEHVLTQPGVTQIVLLTGSRMQSDIIYKDYFTQLAHTHPHLTFIPVVSDKTEQSEFKKGYIQDHVSGYDFNHADVYVCGQEAACNGLVDAVKATNPTDVEFFVEGFH